MNRRTFISGLGAALVAANLWLMPGKVEASKILVDTRERYFDEVRFAMPFIRMAVDADPPPADPPEDGLVWNWAEGLWVETDATFRARIVRDLITRERAHAVNTVTRYEVP